MTVSPSLLVACAVTVLSPEDNVENSDDSILTFDITVFALSKGKYDETTTLNGVSLVKLLNEQASKAI